MNDRLREARINAGFATASEAARAMDMPVATYTHHENGTREFSATVAERYARRYGVSASWILFGRDGLKAPALASSNTSTLSSEPAPSPNASFPPTYQAFPSGETVALLGQSEGGPNGRFIMNGQEIQRIFCPPSLQGVEGAYALMVYGTSMEPKFEAGETVWLHPYLPIRRGDYVVAQVTGEDEGGELGAYIKQFVARTPRGLVLRQINPAEGEDEEITFPIDRVFSVHKVVFHALV